MAVHGFSIFMGFFPIFIYTLIFIMLFTFQKYRAEYGIYYDAMFSGAMSLYLMFYYIAFNYPEGAESTGDRSLIMCILILLFLMGCLTASLGWMCAGSFWNFVKAKSDAVPDIPQHHDTGDEAVERSVSFSNNAGEPEQRRVFHRNLNNKIILLVTMAIVILPLLYRVIDVFKNTTADTINYDNKCWVGGGNGLLMYIILYIPAMVSIICSVGFYVWCAMSRDKQQFCSAEPTDVYIRNIQLRIILISGLGLWWLIEIPALAKGSAAAVQYLNGLINIPLSFLAYNIFVYRTPGIMDTWDTAFPLGKRTKKECQLIWKYYIYRPIRKQINTMNNKHKDRPSSNSSSNLSTPIVVVETEEGTIQRAKQYNVEQKEEEDYKEFQDPNIYENAAHDSDGGKPLVISQQPVAMVSTTAQYDPVSRTTDEILRYDPATDVTQSDNVVTPQYDNVPDKILQYDPTTDVTASEVDIVVTTQYSNVPGDAAPSYDVALDAHYDTVHDDSPTNNDPTAGPVINDNV